MISSVLNHNIQRVSTMTNVSNVQLWPQLIVIKEQMVSIAVHI